MNPIIDTHAHIDQVEDWPVALENCKAHQVSDIVAVSVDLPSMQKVLALSQQAGPVKIHPALGVHPGMVKDGVGEEAFEFMRGNISKAVAIGETGLDYWYKWVRDNQDERGKQKQSLLRHLTMAKEFDLPVIIHSRGAWRDCLSMARQEGVKRALFHWYSGPVDILSQIIEAGYYVSTSPSVGYSPPSQQAMLAAPLERILIETDSPVTYRDGTESYVSQPKDVRKTLASLAVLRKMEEEKLLNIVNHNAKIFFRI